MNSDAFKWAERLFQPLPLAVLLAGLTFWLFQPALRHEFLNYDDGMYVYGNAMVREGVSEPGLHYAFTAIHGGSWMPLTWLSHMLDVSVFGLNPAGHHLTSILLHALNAGLLLGILARASGRLWPAACVAALFAFHPLRNESVAWVAERKDVLCAFFWMLGMVAYWRYVARPGRWRFGLVMVALIAALMSKPMAVTFPFVLLLLDVWPLRRLGLDGKSLRLQLPQLLREKLGLFLIIAVMAAATYWSQREVGAMKDHSSGVGERVLGAGQHYWFYGQKWLWPADLSILYPETSPAGWLAIAGAAGLFGMSWLALRRASRWPWVFVGWFWFLGTAVPIIGLVRVGHITVADRYTYLPSIGLAILVVWTVAGLIQNRAGWRYVGVSVGLLWLGGLAYATRVDLARWQNSLTLFEAVNRVAPHAVAWNSIAVYHLDRGDFVRAIEPATRAIELNSRYENAYVNRAIAREKTGDLEGAKLDLARVEGNEPRSVAGYHNRAADFLAQGRYAEAIQDYTRALEFDPAHAITFNNRANARQLDGHLEGAIQDARRAIELAPDYANAHVNLGNAFQARQEYSAALTHYSQAIKLAPDDPLPFHNRAAVHFRLEQYEAAWADLRQCRQRGGVPHPALVELLIKATGTNHLN